MWLLPLTWITWQSSAPAVSPKLIAASLSAAITACTSSNLTPSPVCCALRGHAACGDGACQQISVAATGAKRSAAGRTTHSTVPVGAMTQQMFVPG